MDIEQRLRDALASRADAVHERTPDPKEHGRKPLHRPPVRVIALVAAGLTVCAMAYLAIASPATPLPTARTARTHADPAVHSIDVQSEDDPMAPSYPASMRVSSVSAAQKEASFNVVVPDATAANASTLTSIFVLPGGAVAFDYEVPATPTSFVRQAYIEIYESHWDANKDPENWYQAMLKADPNPDSSIVDIDGVSAFVVKAHSAADVQKANPAFLRMVVDGLEFQISGGESLELVESIASSVIQGAK